MKIEYHGGARESIEKPPNDFVIKGALNRYLFYKFFFTKISLFAITPLARLNLTPYEH